MSSTVALSSANEAWRQLVADVVATGQAVDVLADDPGQPVAVLVEAREYEALLATVELLTDPQARAEVEQARKEIDAGQTVSLDELRADLEGRQAR